ncbi:hypothetical protein PF005_g24648 [Phytophthora fragariae]|uniref:Uncharacterized protein n=1 Tax=Phytophthora fragariae TaxID=53985 RepID=A0A6A3DRY4_9STRA|nr:hypothetical protein PF003_g36853 [Phytophthora fragariae]KAE8924329.1 hypothetical protein PF009_g25437 [Phytophthora fragariae]KAE8978660.1 hypothetical protein PF011_g23151 [Phytophthora fragariae]KAE9075766.1 hypothetical protein PF010_g24176 [Phytophthora fragariae]KAE9076375.1 hypothetical protein PF007_g24645 [Phytophthora fragariae]
MGASVRLVCLSPQSCLSPAGGAAERQPLRPQGCHSASCWQLDTQPSPVVALH